MLHGSKQHNNDFDFDFFLFDFLRLIKLKNDSMPRYITKADSKK